MLNLIPAIIFISVNYRVGRIAKDRFKGKSATMFIGVLLPLLGAKIGDCKITPTMSDRQ